MSVITDLIIQAEEVATSDLKALYALSRASSIARIDKVEHQAFRLASANPETRAAVHAFCQPARLDFAFMPAERTLSDIGLIAMDMDSTLITIECIDEIADFTGRKQEVATITASAMRGEIDWPESLRRRVALLAGSDESVLQQVFDDRLKLSPGAVTLLSAAKKVGIKLLLVSGGFTFFTEKLMAQLGLDFAFSNQLEIENGKLTGRVLGDLCDADAKARHLRKTAVLLGLSRENCIAIGDGANDLKMMAEAGISIAFRAKPVVQAQAAVAINHVGLDGVLGLLA